MAKKNKKNPDILSDETIKYHIEARANSLNGQLRGAINQRAREENLELIITILSEIFTDGLNQGIKIGYLTKLQEES